MSFPLEHLIRLRHNPELPFIYDVELNNIEALKKYTSVEVHLVLYPFSRQLLSDGYRFNPFEEYSNDISTRRRSLYSRVPHPANSIFGIALGIAIILVFFFLRPSEIYSLQSIVAILGAYFIGKDLWNDIQAGLVQISQNWRLRYQTTYYEYQVEKNTTLTNYSALAREQRYGKASIVPTQMEFISNANSKTIRMKFNAPDLHAFHESAAHVLSIRIDPNLADEFARAGFMFSVKVSFNERAGFLRRSHEFFQSLHAGKLGCLDLNNVWIPEAAVERDTFFLSNLRYLAAKRIIPDVAIVVQT